jgi:hypothetical protein
MHIDRHIYPDYVPAHNMPRSKKVKNRGRHQKKIAAEGPQFSSSKKGDVGSFGLLLLPMCSHQVLNVFLLSSQCVPQHVLNSTSLRLISFVQCCPLETYIGGPILGLISLYVWSEYFYIGGVSKFSEFLWDSPIKEAQ